MKSNDVITCLGLKTATGYFTTQSPDSRAALKLALGYMVSCGDTNLPSVTEFAMIAIWRGATSSMPTHLCCVMNLL